VADGDRPQPGVAMLEKLDLIRPIDTGRAFGFAHALVQETAYGMVDDRRRRSLHLRAARAIERLHSAPLDDVLDRLAYHYVRSGDVERGVEHLTRFASRAARMKARAESVAALGEALTCIEQVPEGAEQDRLFLRFVLQQRAALREMGDIQVGKLELLLRQRARVDASDDREAKRAFHLWLGRVATTCGEFEMGIECAGHAARIAVREGDRITEGAAMAALAHAHGWLGHGTYALACGHRAVGLLEDAGDPFWLGYALRGLTWAHHICAQHAEASATARRLAEVAAEAEVPFYVFSAIWMGALADLYLGRSAHAVAEFRRARDAATTRLWLAQASAFLGVAYIERGEPGAAISVLTPLVAEAERLRQPHVQAYFTARLGEAHVLAGDATRARELGLTARALARTSRFRLAYGHATRTVGRAARAAGDTDKAVRILEEACAVFASIPCAFEAERVRNDLSLRH
jgi:tetratricopeptide (TPR) repeat protein